MPIEENYYYDFDEDDDEESALIDIFNTHNRYNIIYAAPSWNYDQSPEELLKLPVNKVANKNCALFLWIKNNQMVEALNVIDKWGFTYRTVVFVWIKTTEDDKGKQSLYFDTTSDWTCEPCEFCLLATKGTVQRVNDNVPQLVTHTMKYEGNKSEDFKKLTVQLLGDLPALELFPDIDSLERDEPFTTRYNENDVVWDMVAPKLFLEQRAEDRRIEMKRDALGL